MLLRRMPDPKDPTQTVHPAAPNQTGAPRILLVDDRLENLTALEAALSGLNASFVRAQSGEEALRHLLEEEFALALLDIRMPGRDGFETAGLIRARPATRHLPIIFITAIEPNPEETAKAYALGAVDFLAKPLKPEILRSKLGVLVDLFRRGQELQESRDELERRVDDRTREARQATERMRLVLGGALDAVVMIDEAGRIVDWNPQAERLFGWSRAEAIDRTMAELIVPREFRERHQKGLETYLATGQGPILGKRLELPALRKDGRRIPIELTVIPLRVNSKAFFSAFIRDLSEQKKAEENLALLASVVRSSDDAIYTITLDGTLTSWNEGAQRMFGFREEEVLNRPVTLLMPETLYEEEQQILKRVTRGDRDRKSTR